MCYELLIVLNYFLVLMAAWPYLMKLCFSFLFSLMMCKGKKIESLDSDITELQRKIRETAKERDVVQQHKLMDLAFNSVKKILDNQRVLSKLDLESVQRKLDELKEKLQSLESVTEKTEEYLNEKKKVMDEKWRLETNIKELRALLRDTDNLLQSLTGMDGFKSLTESRTESELILQEQNDKLSEREREREEKVTTFMVVHFF